MDLCRRRMGRLWAGDGLRRRFGTIDFATLRLHVPLSPNRELVQRCAASRGLNGYSSNDQAQAAAVNGAQAGHAVNTRA